MRIPRSFVPLVAIIGLAACGSDNRELVGTVEGTDAFIGVVLGADRSIAYVCDGTEAAVTISQWFDGVAEKGAIQLSAEGLQVSGALADGVLTGSVMLADGPHVFSAAPATAPAGLYRDDSSYEDTLGGWIVLADGRMRGAVRAPGTGGIVPAGGSVDGNIVKATSGAVVLTGVRLLTPTAPIPAARDLGTPSCSQSRCNSAGVCNNDGSCACFFDACGATCQFSRARTCNGRGACTFDGSCICDPIAVGPSCATCAANHFGPTCRACSRTSTCNGHGACDANGFCTCDTGFTGTSCNQCAPSFFAFPTCRFCAASTTCMGHGVCTADGLCQCNPGFAGASCEVMN